jgi:Putative beta-barrel porin-2, OmpL-like. bbp2
MFPVVMLAAVLALGQATPDLEKPEADKSAAEKPAGAPPAREPALDRPSAANPTASSSTPNRWLFMKELQGTPAGAMLDDSRTQIYGWVDAGATFGTAPGNNLPLGFNYRDNALSLQQNWLRVERTVVTSGTIEPTYGFRSDTILPGTDYRFTVAKGLLSSQLTGRDGQPNTYGIDPVQFYAEAYYPTVCRGLDIKVGRFYAQYGVESIEAPGNALFSHAYSFLDNPFTQTGVVATLQMTAEWSAQSGVVLGGDVFFDGGQPTFIGNVKWAKPNGQDSVTLSTILGSGRFDPTRQLNNVNILDLVVTHKFTSLLSYSFETLAGYQDGVPGVGTAHWLGIVNYLTYDFTPRVSGTIRQEFWDDAQGNRTGAPGLYTTLTGGLNYHPLKSVIFRPELRYDYNDDSRPFQGQHTLFTAAADLILRW